MGSDTGISWTDSTWNPIRGCSRVSAGCVNCYAERVANRFSGPGKPYEGLINKRGVWNGVVRMVHEHLADPLRWRKPRRIFVNSMSDLFHEGLSNDEIAAVFGVMAAAPQHTFQILTKRATRMREWFAWFSDVIRNEAAPDDRGNECLARVLAGCAQGELGDGSSEDEDRQFWRIADLIRAAPVTWPLPNVWLGVSVENQEAADGRIPELLATPAKIRFLSCEPLIGPVNLDLDCEHVDHEPMAIVDWVIAGCESGPGARACDVTWLRSLRDQCAAFGVAFFLKQAVDVMTIGASGVVHSGISFGDGTKAKGSAGRASVLERPYLDGVQHLEFPA